MKDRGAIFILAALLCLPLMTGCEEEEHVHAPPLCRRARSDLHRSGLCGILGMRPLRRAFFGRSGQAARRDKDDPRARPQYGQRRGKTRDVRRGRAPCHALSALRGGRGERFAPNGASLRRVGAKRSLPSCDREGKEAHICAYCGASETRALPALAEHAFGADNVCTVCAYVCEPTPGLAYTPVLGEDGNLAGYEGLYGRGGSGQGSSSRPITRGFPSSPSRKRASATASRSPGSPATRPLPKWGRRPSAAARRFRKQSFPTAWKRWGRWRFTAAAM